MKQSLEGLAERAAKRRSDRARLSSLTRKVKDYPKNEQKARHRAIVYLSTLPTKDLVAVHKAAMQQFDKR
jgi:hypothetical protein